jgi:regulator of replication initiation timing
MRRRGARVDREVVPRHSRRPEDEGSGKALRALRRGGFGICSGHWGVWLGSDEEGER